jgi:DNA-directed RNA polymerase specialized sigma24 family protein
MIFKTNANFMESSFRIAEHRAIDDRRQVQNMTRIESAEVTEEMSSGSVVTTLQRARTTKDTKHR